LRRHVLDSSVVLAFAFREPGADAAAAALDGAVMSSANLAEVATRLVDAGFGDDEVDAFCEAIGVEIVPLTAATALAAARLRIVSRPLGLSLGDRICIALSVELGLPALTCDRAWLKLDPRLDIRSLR